MTTDTPTPGETPQAQPVTGPTVEQQPAIPPSQPAEPTEEPFDKERAMRTISTLREIEKQARKDKQELDRLQAEQRKREEAELTEQQRLQKQADDLKAENARLQADIWRGKAIAETGIPSILAERLQGSSYDEMLADAKKLAEALPKQTAPKIPPTNPGNADPNETAAQQRARLFGDRVDPFAGGGVVWKTDNNQ